MGVLYKIGGQFSRDQCYIGSLDIIEVRSHQTNRNPSHFGNVRKIADVN